MSKDMSAKKPATVRAEHVSDMIVEPEYAQIAAPGATEDVIGKRIEEMRASRKARGPSDPSEANYKLSVPEVLKDKRLEYRWVNDREMRVYQMEGKGWQIADADTLADPRNTGLGSRVERIANERTTPKVEKCFLMWKPKEFYQEDEARKQAQIKENENQLKRGETRDPQGLSGPHQYIPAGGIKIEQGS